MRPARALSLLLGLLLAMCCLVGEAGAVAVSARAGAQGVYIRRINELEKEVAQRDEKIAMLERKLEAEVEAEKAAHATTKQGLQAEVDRCMDSLEKQKAMASAMAQN